MKKNFFYATMSAIALTSAIGFTACSSDDAATDVNPTYDGNSVKTQFTISFPQNVAKTRMTGGTVQSVEDIASFRGMDNIVLYPFAATGAANVDPVANNSTKLGEAISLTSMIKPTVSNISNSIPAGASGLTANNNSVLFNDVTIPIGTGSFLFYGKAIDNTTDKFYNGSLNLINTTASNTTPDPVNPANIAFDLDPTYTATSASSVGTALATYLTSIALVTNWAECANPSNSEQAYYNEGLGDLYTNFIKMKAGSSLTAQAAVQDLYGTISKNTDALSIAIATAITNNTYVSAYDANAGTLTFTAAIGNSATTYFPGDVNLPDGAALLSWDSTNKEFVQSTSGTDLFGTTGTSKITNAYADYVYPASLYYYCNSGIGTAASSQASEYKATQSDNTTAQQWSDILNNYTPKTQVQSNTRSVAILDPIQYAVGRMDMKVKALTTTTSNSKKLMYDKKGDEYDAVNGFDVTGVLIGGQKQVGFDFTPQGTAEKTIYDNITKSQPGTTLTVTPSADSGTNYTLALETSEDTPVYVAVEFVNNGADFEGADGVIPAGCKFYLVGKLTPSSGTGYHTTTMNQVFKQDYKTIVNFTIAQGISGSSNSTGLGAAYNVVPDLRTPQLELGLSVDLTWQEGIQFDVTF